MAAFPNRQIRRPILYDRLVSATAFLTRAPDRVWGEIVVAYVVLQAGQSLTDEELIAFARTRMAAYKIPECVVFMEALPRTPTGKLDRRALREAEQARASL